MPNLKLVAEEALSLAHKLAPEATAKLEHEALSLLSQSKAGRLIERFGEEIAPHNPAFRDLPSIAVENRQVKESVMRLPPEAPTAKLFDKVSPSVFNLRSIEGDEEFGVGTAFVADDKHLVTAQHCTVSFSGVPNLFIRDGKTEEKHWLKVVANDPAADVALLRFRDSAPCLPEPLPLGTSNGLRQGQSILNFGYPASVGKLVVTEGPLQKIENYFEKSGWVLQSSPSARLTSHAVAFHGNSGGPAFADNKVVGVVTGGMHDSGRSIATSIEHVRLLIEQAQSNSLAPYSRSMRSIGRALSKGDKFKVTVKAAETPSF